MKRTINIPKIKRTFEGFEETTWRRFVPNDHELFVDYPSRITSNCISDKKTEENFKKLNQMTSKLIKEKNITFKY